MDNDRRLKKKVVEHRIVNKGSGGRIMSTKLRILTILLLSLLVSGSLGKGEAFAWMTFFDERLEVRGRFELWNTWRLKIPREERDFHSTRLGSFQTQFQIEGLYHLVENDDLIINLFGYFRYFREAGPDIDREMRDGIPTWVRKRYQEHHWRDDDPIQELFVDIITGPWTFRLGKQIVVWGETGLRRTADVVNPLDFRYGLPGVLEFEDLKTGLWMVKTMYETDLPGDLIFEVVWIPSDYENFKIPQEGTPLGGPTIGDPVDGIFTEIQKKWDDDEPGHQFSNGEGGFRIRGFSWDLDWTIEYFNTIDDTPTVRKSKIDILNAYIPIYFMTKPESTINQLIPLSLARGAGFNNPWEVKRAWRNQRIWNYNRTQYFGATFQTYVDLGWLKSIVRGEFVFEQGKSYVLRDSEGLAYDVKNKDAFNYGIAINRRFSRPRWLMQLTGNRALQVTFQLFQDWVINHEKDLSIRGRGRGDNNVTTFTLQCMTDFMKQTLTVVTRNLYNTSGTGYNSISTVYGPGDHWRYELGVIQFYSWVDVSQEDASKDKDFLYFKLRYEF
jgi:hypothetical protein